MLNARGSGSIGRVSRKAAEAVAKAAAIQAVSFEDEMEEIAKDVSLRALPAKIQLSNASAGSSTPASACQHGLAS